MTRNYFENLVQALENGLVDVDAHGAYSRAASSKSLGGGSSKAKGGRGKGTTSKTSSSRNIDDSGHWSCEYCTYANVRSATACQMCQQRRWSHFWVATASVWEFLNLLIATTEVQIQMKIRVSKLETCWNGAELNSRELWWRSMKRWPWVGSLHTSKDEMYICLLSVIFVTCIWHVQQNVLF